MYLNLKLLLEHIIHSNVTAHFDKYNILKDNQHGFRKKRSCETQLVTTVQEIASRLSKGEQVNIMIDSEKAFDKVAHSRLLYKFGVLWHKRNGSKLDQSLSERQKTAISA